MAESTNPLRDSAFIQALLDLVIPASSDGKMPSAGSLGFGDDLAVKIEADARLGAPVQAGLRAVRDAALERDPGGLSALSSEGQNELLESQLGAHPGLIMGLSVHLYPAYYSHPSVLEGLGEPARAPFPEGYEVEATDEALLEILRARSRS